MLLHKQDALDTLAVGDHLTWPSGCHELRGTIVEIVGVDHVQGVRGPVFTGITVKVDVPHAHLRPLRLPQVRAQDHHRVPALPRDVYWAYTASPTPRSHSHDRPHRAGRRRARHAHLRIRGHARRPPGDPASHPPRELLPFNALAQGAAFMRDSMRKAADRHPDRQRGPPAAHPVRQAEGADRGVHQRHQRPRRDSAAIMTGSLSSVGEAPSCTTWSTSSTSPPRRKEPPGTSNPPLSAAEGVSASPTSSVVRPDRAARLEPPPPVDLADALMTCCSKRSTSATHP